MTKRNKYVSNRYNFKTYIELSCFNTKSKHNIEISLNGTLFYKKSFEQNKEYNIKITDYLDFQEPGGKKLRIKWDGEYECEDKFLKIYKIIVNEQHLSPYSVRISPKRNAYIDELQSTKEGKDLYNKKIYYPGHQQGWYGDYEYMFYVDPKKTSHDKDVELVHACGVNNKTVLSELSNVHFEKKANKV